MISPRHTTRMSIQGEYLCLLSTKTSAICYVCVCSLLLLLANPPPLAEQMCRCEHLVTVYAHTPQHLFFFECFKLSKGLGVIGAYPLPHVLPQFFCDSTSKVECVKQMKVSTEKKLYSFGSLHLQFKSLFPDLNFLHPEFICRILNLLISLPLSLSFSLSTSSSFL